MTGDDGQRAAGLSRQLREVHQFLRDQLAELRAEPGPGRPAGITLSAHCLAFCSVLTTHHAGEDGLFAALLADRPDLAASIAKLVEDHAAIAAILRQVRALAGRARTAPADSLPGLRRELDGLAAIAESHFRYEERALSAALDEGVADTGWSRPVFSPAEP